MVFRIRNKKTGEFLDGSRWGQYTRKNKIYYTLANARGILWKLLRDCGIYSGKKEDIEKYLCDLEIVEYELREINTHSCTKKDSQISHK
jgi:hypothetical protein